MAYDKLSGIIPAMVTPATDDGSDVDLGRACNVTRRLVRAGVHGLFVCASTGEGPLLERDQRNRLIETVAQENAGKLPLLVGVGAMSTQAAVRNAKEAAERGATYIVILPLHFFKVSEQELESYFATIVDSVQIPSILYNYPDITSGQNISPKLAARLVCNHNVVAVKDSSGDLTQTLEYVENCGYDFSVFTGSEPLLLSLLSHGGDGAICSAANVIPELLVRLYNYFTDGEIENALEVQRQVLKVSSLWKLGTFPAAVKAGCAVRGTPVGPPFAPVEPLDEDNQKILERSLEEMQAYL